ncbi:amidohydrolase [Acrocarpospora phusangensis]|uniref:Amidohydrolase n=1 Tax=Acrocarpospora phusangensis TaxID=1070424 RepID=A0A919UMZ2_9ACTN|nr:amidase family protein [Acrocarpospora phusangensis]GIH23808.1 amidohydrolase [Acrocarpospora phusangensis]
MGIDPFVLWGTPPETPGGSGPLAGVRLAVKDVFDVAGTPTGAGHPRWLETHGAATGDAGAVARLRAAGAVLAGKTHTDEFAYSLGGTNQHYGIPENPAAPGHVCGGSSSGSAAAVAAGLADLGLGTDTAGSIRVPASYTGLYGFRPTHARAPRDGMVPLAPEFDVPGLLTRDLGLLRTAAGALLDGTGQNTPATRLCVPPDLWAEQSPRVGAALAAAIARLGLPVHRTPLGHDVTDAFAIAQAAQAWECHGEWITRERPGFGPGVAARFRRAEGLTREEVTLARKALGEAADRIRVLLDGGGVLVLPAAPGAAPAIGRPEDRRLSTLRLTCLAPLSGGPALSLPAGLLDGRPIGLCLMTARGHDEVLFDLAARL